jgi:hypothetical protein
MMNWLLVLHIAALGYWFGAELVINSTYRFVCYADDMPFADRDQLMSHVLRVDQHVRYALILQVSIGTMLAAKVGYIPGGELMTLAAGIFGLCWLLFIETVHRMRKQAIGHRLAFADRIFRYGLITLLLLIAASIVGHSWPLPEWLRWKFVFFAGVIACGAGIRLVLIKQFKIWALMAAGEIGPHANAKIKQYYVSATSILFLLWAFIAVIVYLSVAKPI